MVFHSNFTTRQVAGALISQKSLSNSTGISTQRGAAQSMPNFLMLIFLSEGIEEAIVF